MITYASLKKENSATACLRELFRTHGKDEYFEFITRGMGKGGKKSVNAVYPWVYSRVFLLCLITFAALSFVTEFTFSVMMGMGHPVLVLTGAMLVTAPVIVLFFELYPKRDLNFLQLMLVFIIGGAASDIIINLGYYLVSTSDTWLSVLWTAFLEEAGKAIPAIIAIIILKADNPLKCFVIAAAVGSSMAVSEDMGYIFFGSTQFGISVSSTVTMTLLRALTSISAHVVWTGFIGWAYGKFKWRVLDIRFWLVCLGSMALHYIWDFPVPFLNIFTLLGAFIGGIVITVFLVRTEREKVYFEELLVRDRVDYTEYIADGIKSLNKNHCNYSVYKYNVCGITAVICAVIISVCGLVFCVKGKSGGYNDLYFSDASEFTYFMHSGNYHLNFSRKYDADAPNFAEYWENGELKEVTQREIIDDTTYYYTYYIGIGLTDIRLEVDGVRYESESLFTEDGEVKYFKTNPDVVDCYYDPEYDEYIVVTYTPVEYDWFVNVLLGSVSGAAFLIGASATVYALVAARRKKLAAKAELSLGDIEEEEIETKAEEENCGGRTDNE